MRDLSPGTSRTFYLNPKYATEPAARGGALSTHSISPNHRSATIGRLRVHAVGTADSVGTIAAGHVATTIRERLAATGRVRVVFAAAPSQDAVLRALSREPDIDWSRVTAFQMDEYIGLGDDHPQSFATYLETHIYSLVKPGVVHKMRPRTDGTQEAARYVALLAEAPIDLVLLGIGENGHIAFNDPGVADFNDPLVAKVVGLDDVSRQQQVNDGAFQSISDVPTHAITLTVPTLVGGATLVACVSSARKQAAVRQALFGPIGPDCPASAMRRHDDAHLYLDDEASPPGLVGAPRPHP